MFNGILPASSSGDGLHCSIGRLVRGRDEAGEGQRIVM